MVCQSHVTGHLGQAVNYLDDLPLPSARRSRIKATSSDHLYPLIVEEDDERQLVKVHYKDYSTSYDERRSRDEIVEQYLHA